MDLQPELTNADRLAPVERVAQRLVLALAIARAEGDTARGREAIGRAMKYTGELTRAWFEFAE